MSSKNPDGDCARVTASHKAELAKRKLKGADSLLTKAVDVSDGLFEALPEAVREELTELLGWTANNRDLLSASVSAHLLGIVEGLLKLGFQPVPKGNVRPRRFDDKAWQALGLAEEICGLPRVQLLRAALRRLAEKGVGNINLAETVAKLEELKPARSNRRAKR